MKQYPKILDQIDEDAKTIILAREFGIPCKIKTIVEGHGGPETYYDTDYCDFGMLDEKLEELVDSGLRCAKLHITHLISHVREEAQEQ